LVEPLIQIMLNGWLRICRRNRREQEMVINVLIMTGVFVLTCYASHINLMGYIVLYYSSMAWRFKWCRLNMMLLRKLFMAWNLEFCLGTVTSLPHLYVVLLDGLISLPSFTSTP